MEIELDKIIVEGNRKFTKDDGFEQLVNSIREHGVIEPPVVRRVLEGGFFRVVAGRRRIDAMQQIAGEKKGKGAWLIDCVVIDADDPRSDEEIALAENVNRLEMHPLDEAALFTRMAERGASVEEIAKYYARSPSAIYQRLRLAGLADELKGMFRDEKIGIGSAAVLAELPEDDQTEFFKQYGNKDRGIETSDIASFVRARQRFVIGKLMRDCCGACARRTHNEGNELFEEFSHVSDVCLEPECYRRQWGGIIERALAEHFDENLPTDNKIYFYNGMPALLYKKASYAEFFFGDGNVRFEVLKGSGYEFTGETKRKKDACWKVSEKYGGGLVVQRIGYAKKEPKAKGEDTAAKNGALSKTDIENFGVDALESAAEGLGYKDAQVLAKALKGKNLNGYGFKNDIEELIYKRVTAMRIEAAGKGEPAGDYLSIFLGILNDECCADGGSYIKEFFSAEQKKWLHDLLKVKSLGELILSDEVQQLFHFLLLTSGSLNRYVPHLDELKDIEKSSNLLFFKYTGLSVAEYRELYLTVAKEVAAEALALKKKKNGKDKAASVEEETGATDPDMEMEDDADESEAPF